MTTEKTSRPTDPLLGDIWDTCIAAIAALERNDMTSYMALAHQENMLMNELRARHYSPH